MSEVIEVIKQALDFADNKLQKGLLIRCRDVPDSPPDGYWSTPEGDRETIWSIASMYSDANGFDMFDFEIIEDALIDKYPQYT